MNNVNSQIGKRQISIGQIAHILESEFVGPNVQIQGLHYADYHSRYDAILTYVSSKLYVQHALNKNNFKAIIIAKKVYDQLESFEKKKITFLLADDPISSFFYVHNYLNENTIFYSEYDFVKKIGENSNIHDSVAIENGVTIGENVKIGPNCSILRGTVIEDFVRIDANSVVGAPGFEAKNISGTLTPIAHVGGVKLQKGARIGANCHIARSLFEGQTIIGRESQIDSMVHISHEVELGQKTVIAAGTFVGGSVKIGSSSYIGLGVKISNKLKIGDNVKINIGSVVVEDIADNQTVAGYYSMPNTSWLAKMIDEKKKYTRNRN